MSGIAHNIPKCKALKESVLMQHAQFRMSIAAT